MAPIRYSFFRTIQKSAQKEPEDGYNTPGHEHKREKRRKRTENSLRNDRVSLT